MIMNNINRHYSFKLKDEFVRGMNRQQYKAASHWARLAARIVDSKINWDVFNRHIFDTMIYGTSIIRTEDILI